MHPQDYSRRVAYRPPATWYRRISNRLGVWLTSTGLAPRGAATLTVRGRKSGRLRRVPVLVAPYRGEDYLVALAGESDWVRNVRAADGHAVIRRRAARPVRLVELPVDDRPEIIAEYLRLGARWGSSAAAQQARYYFGLDPDPTLTDIRAVAGYYPVFRATYLGGTIDEATSRPRRAGRGRLARRAARSRNRGPTQGASPAA